MTTLLFATNNQHKITEVQGVCPPEYNIVGLQSAGIIKDIPEPYDTLHQNAYTKCKTIANLTGNDCFSEDTGLEVEVLNGAPGVKTARYAGDSCSNTENIKLILRNMKNFENRDARFRTVICLCQKDAYYYFEGVCEGRINKNSVGENGFGYDPIFVPKNYTLTFSEMDKSVKYSISHRTLAFQQFILFLQQKNLSNPPIN